MYLIKKEKWGPDIKENELNKIYNNTLLNCFILYLNLNCFNKIYIYLTISYIYDDFSNQILLNYIFNNLSISNISSLKFKIFFYYGVCIFSFIFYIILLDRFVCYYLIITS